MHRYSYHMALRKSQLRSNKVTQDHTGSYKIINETNKKTKITKNENKKKKG